MPGGKRRHRGDTYDIVGLRAQRLNQRAGGIGEGKSYGGITLLAQKVRAHRSGDFVRRAVRGKTEDTSGAECPASDGNRLGLAQLGDELIDTLDDKVFALVIQFAG